MASAQQEPAGAGGQTSDTQMVARWPEQAGRPGRRLVRQRWRALPQGTRQAVLAARRPAPRLSGYRCGTGGRRLRLRRVGVDAPPGDGVAGRTAGWGAACCRPAAL